MRRSMTISVFSRLFLWPSALVVSALTLSGCGGGSSSSPTTPAATNTIAFVSTRNGNPEIYLMNADGSNQTRLTNDAGRDLNPSQSRDGRRIVFESDRSGNSEIYVINRDGSGLQRLTEDSGDNAPIDTQPVFSPDGATIAWTSTRNVGFETDIWLMDSNGGNQRRLTTSASGEGVDNPSFSPDGTRIAYFSQGPRSRYRSSTLQIRDRATGATTVTTVVTNIPRHLRWSPDSSKIAFSDLIPNTNPGRLQIYDVNSRSLSNGPLAGSQNDDPTYSPNASALAWHASAGTFGGPEPRPQIYRANLDGTAPRVLTSEGSNYSPDWR